MSGLFIAGDLKRRLLEKSRSLLTWVPGIIVVAIILWFYDGLWRPGLVLIKRDAFRYFLPVKQYISERLLSGELPQWFPYDGLGRPLLGIPVTGVFHPFTVLYYALPVHEAYRLSTILSCLAAGVGAYLLGRVLRFSEVGAVFAGVAFACSGYVASLTENLVYLYSVCLLPIFCMTLEKALTQDWRWIPVPAIVWASVFLNGDVQNGYYYGFLAIAWGLLRTTSRGRTLLRLTAVAVLAGLLAAIQLAPAWAVYLHSNRANPEAFHYQSVLWSTHPLRLFGLVVGPGPIQNFLDLEIAHTFFGAQAPNQNMTGLWAESLYVGLPVLGLALMAGIARPDLRIFLVIGGTGLWLALGQYGGLFDWLYGRMPLWTAFRYPEKLMGYVSFSVAMLSGGGMDEWRNGKGGPKAWLFAAGSCVALVGVMHVSQVVTWVSSYFGSRPGLTSEALGLASKGLLFSAALALAFGCSTLWRGKDSPTPGWMWMAIITLVLLDLYRVNALVCHTGPVEAWEFTPNFVEPIRKDSGHDGPGFFRVVPFREPIFIVTGEMKNALDAYQVSSAMLKQSLDLEHNAVYHIESPYGYLPGFDESFDALGKVFSASIAARFNVAYYIGRLYHFEKVKQIPVVAYVPANDLALTKNPVFPKPRAYVSLKPEASSHPVDIVTLAQKKEFLSGALDVLEVPDQLLEGVAGQGTAEIVRYEPERIEILVNVADSGALVLSDNYAEGWTAQLEDGRSVPVLRANALMRAVIIPAGRHSVIFSYQTPLLAGGAWLSAIGCLISLVLFFGPRSIAERAYPTM